MDKKQKIVLLVTILFLILLCGGLSYAFFSTVTNSESSSTILATVTGNNTIDLEMRFLPTLFDSKESGDLDDNLLLDF